MKRKPPTPAAVFETYWRFAAERQRIFFRRACRRAAPWTDDPILRQYKFTNAYRASDRVSQYLIRNVIYDSKRDFANTLLRVLLFKIFNRIETWEILEAAVGEINLSNFRPSCFESILDSQLEAGRRVYSAAYIMPTGGQKGRKHRVHLELLQSMVRNQLADRILGARTMQRSYELLREYPTVGPFLAYQWATDLSYSPHLDCDEMEFVVPGPGAQDGLAKCFSDLGDWTGADTIRWMAQEQEGHFASFGIQFSSLWGRPLQLIDCQNLFCEVDKYARVKHPEIPGRSGRKQIKQKFRVNQKPIEFFYPPKWKLRTDASLISDAVV